MTSNDISCGLDVENLILILGCDNAHISNNFEKFIDDALCISLALEKSFLSPPPNQR